MNLALYGYGSPKNREWIMVDCGVTFPSLELPGVDLVLPDIRFLEEERNNLKAIIITHAHEDHYGAVNDLWPRLKVPVYVSRLPQACLRPNAPMNVHGRKFQLIFIMQVIGLKLGHSKLKQLPLIIRYLNRFLLPLKHRWEKSFIQGIGKLIMRHLWGR